MPDSPITLKGKVKAPKFDLKSDGGGSKPKHNLLLYGLIVAAGVGIIWYIRNKGTSQAGSSQNADTNPAVSLNGGAAPDQSTIDNLTASILALQGQQSNTSSGGTSTPITQTPSSTNPGQGATDYLPIIGNGGQPLTVNPADPATLGQGLPDGVPIPLASIQTTLATQFPGVTVSGSAFYPEFGTNSKVDTTALNQYAGSVAAYNQKALMQTLQGVGAAAQAKVNADSAAAKVSQ